MKVLPIIKIILSTIDRCDKKYNSHRGLLYHTKSVHENGTRYKCDVCKYSTLVKSGLTRHIKSIHLKEKFDCKLCDYKATTKGSLNQHLDSVHRRNIITCQICNKILKKRNLATHKKFVHGDQKSPNQHCCKMCPYQTNRQSNLKSHTEIVHQKLKKTKI